jgi:hypothetical protein
MNLYNYTQVTISKLQKEKVEEKKLIILNKFIKRLWKILPPSEIGFYIMDSSTWNKVYFDLNYFSDEWSFLRLYSLYQRYLFLKRIEDNNNIA